MIFTLMPSTPGVQLEAWLGPTCGFTGPHYTTGQGTGREQQVTQVPLDLAPSQTNASNQSMNRTLLQKDARSATEHGTDKDQEQDVPFLTRHRVITEGQPGG